MRVRVYYDSTRKTFSLKERGLVTAKADEVVLRDVRFVVWAAGRDRVRRTGRKTPHAFVEGELVSTNAKGMDVKGEAFRYNPHRDEGFTSNGKMLSGAQAVRMAVEAGRPNCQVWGAY